MIIIWYQALNMPTATAQTLRPRDLTSEVQKTGFSKRLRRHKYTNLFLLWSSKNFPTHQTHHDAVHGRCPFESHVLEISLSMMSQWGLIPLFKVGHNTHNQVFTPFSETTLFIQWVVKQNISFRGAL